MKDMAPPLRFEFADNRLVQEIKAGNWKLMHRVVYWPAIGMGAVSGRWMP